MLLAPISCTLQINKIIINIALRVNMKQPVLLNHARQKSTFSIHSLLLVTLVLSLGACVPTTKKIYHTPAVSGKVIDLETLAPIEGAIIQHEALDDHFDLNNIKTTTDKIVSNKQGEYYLPSLSSSKITLLMPGHAMAHYPVRISTRNNSALVFVSASLLMQDEEITSASLLIMDANPNIIADTPPGDYLDYKLLHTYLYPHSTLSMCDLAIGADAISALNTARKVYWQHINETDVSKQMVNAAYLNVSHNWDYFYTSCDFGDKHTIERRDTLYKVQAISDQIKQEISDLSN